MSTQPLSDLLVEPSSRGEWYPSYETAMAYCRVTKALAAEIGTMRVISMPVSLILQN